MDSLDRRRLVIAILLALGTLAAYSQVFVCGLVNYDDLTYIGKPLVMRGLTSEGLAWAFTGIHSSNWHPVTTISHMLDCTFFGLNPLGHHVVNLLLHIANVALLFLVLERMTKSLWKSAFVAALFAVHPLHVESVAWIAERKDVLSTLFLILTIGAYLLYVADSAEASSAREEGDEKAYHWVIGLYALGLMAKPMLVTLPFVLLLLDYWPLGRFTFGERRKKRSGSWVQSPLIREKIPLFALAGISCAITYYVQIKGGAGVTLAQIPLWLRIENAMMSCAGYLVKTFWPAKLAVFYPYPVHPPALWKPLLAFLVLAAITVGAIRLAKSRGYLAVGWLWYLVTLVPVIGIVQVGEQAMADRYTYIPLIGIFVLIAWGLPDIAQRISASGRVGEWESGRSRVPHSPIPPFPHSLTLAGLAVVILAALGAQTWIQVGYWRDRLTLFSHALKVTDGNYLAHDMVGAALNRQGRYRDAMKHFDEALRIKPRDPFVLMNLGNSLVRLNRVSDAVDAYQEAINVKPGWSLVHFNLAKALVRLGRTPEAVKELLTVDELNSGPRGHPEMFTADLDKNLAKADRLARLLGSRPNDPYLRQTYAMALADTGKLRQAAYILSQKPSSPPKGRISPAQSPEQKLALYRDQVKQDPKDAEARYGLGNALCNLGKRDEGIREYREALRLKPDYLEAHNNLAVALFFVGRYADAWKEVRACRDLGTEPHPDFIKALSAKMPEPTR